MTKTWIFDKKWNFDKNFTKITKMFERIKNVFLLFICCIHSLFVTCKFVKIHVFKKRDANLASASFFYPQNTHKTFENRFFLTDRLNLTIFDLFCTKNVSKLKVSQKWNTLIDRNFSLNFQFFRKLNFLFIFSKNHLVGQILYRSLVPSNKTMSLIFKSSKTKFSSKIC